MQLETPTVILAFFGLAYTAPTNMAREVPQEHSHEKFVTCLRTSLKLDNPEKIQDPILGLLGNVAAAAGAGAITNLDCLHQATAHRAFTNAKAAGDFQAQSDPLIFAAFERNAAGVGTASALCNETAVDPDIAAITQKKIQLPMGAAATNKIASIGGNSRDDLLSGTFAAEGMYFTNKLIVDDATAAEMTGAVAGASAGSSASNSDPAPAAKASASKAGAASASAGSASPASGTNVQSSTDSLGSAAPAVIRSSGDRAFSVNGSTFVDSSAALQFSRVGQSFSCFPYCAGGGGGGGRGQRTLI
ncbi:hypothetical protein MBM_06693 [Drepanopeziza brunnea f. sp. 'multigermtubi' MB_m1]|uniref:Cell wall protein n=1 Tax=Marssonina brunnea f. sp. multigermtubi (strain MB_m1) TaxID=1072389 RepID=K1WRA0_MARBU|nr:uncharacterized protein MBM_06693 [Drepanopeziza brunnea f. sp. 'multigermtubi' MB_m1]EKD14932.1 hypothetical protein MBM_06693 [Drepanopeziza brunnea f. sp. 'multigermtubi' MB_m1]